MAYDDVGRGDPILLIHGFPLSRRIWRPQVEALRSTYRIIAPDLRGHGETEAPEGVYTMADVAADLRRLLDHLGIERAVMAAHSMGGVRGLRFLPSVAGADAGPDLGRYPRRARQRAWP